MSSPSHSEIARTLSDGIAGGRFPVGSLLPTEFELCSQFGASRYSVRRALQALQDQGLITRRKNVGTRVEADRPVPVFTQSVATVDELAQYGAQHIRALQSIDRVTLGAELAQRLGRRAGEPFLRISSMRLEGGTRPRPLGWSDVYVPAEYADIADKARASPERLISSLIEEHFGLRIERVVQEIQATTLPESLAEALCAEAGSPALRLIRHYLDAQGRTFEVSETIHPADRFTFSTVLTRGRRDSSAPNVA